jgi:hypothetical protein
VPARATVAGPAATDARREGDDTVNAPTATAAGDGAAAVPVVDAAGEETEVDSAVADDESTAPPAVDDDANGGDAVAAEPPAGADAAGAGEPDEADGAGPAAAAGVGRTTGAAAWGPVAAAGPAGVADVGAGEVVATGDGDSGADVRGAARGGRNPSGSRYPSACEASRTPRWTLGTACSGSPLEPIVATTAPSSTASPLATSVEPRCTSVTA